MGLLLLLLLLNGHIIFLVNFLENQKIGAFWRRWRRGRTELTSRVLSRNVTGASHSCSRLVKLVVCLLDSCWNFSTCRRYLLLRIGSLLRSFSRSGCYVGLLLLCLLSQRDVTTSQICRIDRYIFGPFGLLLDRILSSLKIGRLTNRRWCSLFWRACCTSTGSRYHLTTGNHLFYRTNYRARLKVGLLLESRNVNACQSFHLTARPCFWFCSVLGSWGCLAWIILVRTCQRLWLWLRILLHYILFLCGACLSKRIYALIVSLCVIFCVKIPNEEVFERKALSSRCFWWVGEWVYTRVYIFYTYTYIYLYLLLFSKYINL